ncbi:ABC transporter substrate-binding protein [Anaerostipes sp.]|uniref:ABC transporter substrate-binding protein n=1 Tax=Anaerostipes sp. TaxID=1872530 RepID=UPI0025BB7B1D|nr:sugar ABC transporter substrate-binding protein [Anaerostipes sp.]MBS7009034.1 sugar ABC transporter substrate-binding protein [Anaerostipes sp.]
MKKLWICCLTVFICAGLLSGCNSKKYDTEKRRTEIILWHYWDIPHNQKQLLNLVEEYNNSQDKVKVTVKYIPDEDLKKQLALSMTDGTMPDLALVDSADFKYFHSLKKFKDLTEEVEEEEYFSEALDACRADGKICGLPFGLNCPALIYNKRMFHKKNIKVPQTWDDFYRAAVKLTDKDTYGFGMTALQSEETMYEFLPILWSMEGDADKISSSESRRAFELITKLVRKKAMSRQCISLTLGDLTNQFIKENVAMMFNSPMTVDTIREQNPNLDFGVAFLPSDKDKKKVSVVGGEILGVTRGKHQKEAVSFVKYLADKRNMEQYLDGFGFLSPRKDVFSKQFAGDEKKEMFKEIFQTARPREFTKEWPDISMILSDVIGDTIIDGTGYEENLVHTAEKIRKIRRENH